LCSVPGAGGQTAAAGGASNPGCRRKSGGVACSGTPGCRCGAFCRVGPGVVLGGCLPDSATGGLVARARRGSCPASCIGNDDGGTVPALRQNSAHDPPGASPCKRAEPSTDGAASQDAAAAMGRGPCG